MKITFQDFRKTLEIILHIDKDPSTITIAYLRREIAVKYDVKYIDISFVYNGYKPTDNATLQSIKYTEDNHIVLTIKNSSNYPKIEALRKPIENEIKEVKDEKKQKKQFIEQLREDLEKDEKNDSDGMNVSMLTQMMANGPMKEMLKNNPELERLMGDEQQMKKILKMATNKDLQDHFMRQSEVALAQIDNIPGGAEELSRQTSGLYRDLDNMFTTKLNYDPNKTNEDFKQKEILDEPFDVFEDLSKPKQNNMNPFDSMGLMGMGNPYGNLFGGPSYQSNFGMNRNTVNANRPQMNTQMRTPMRTLPKQQTQPQQQNQQPKVDIYQKEKKEEKLQKVEQKVEEPKKGLDDKTYNELIETLEVMGFEINDDIRKIVRNSDGDLLQIIEAIEAYNDSKN